MKILLTFDDKFPVDQEKLIGFLKSKSKSIKFDLNKGKYSLKPGLVTKPETFLRL